MKTYDYMLLENMHKAACKDLYALREDFEALNEQLRTTCTELDETKSFLKLVADTCERAEVEVLALRKENAELFQAMQHPSYQEENRLRAEIAAMKATPPVVPSGYQVVDTALLQRASWAIGRFIEGGDWTQEDMDVMDDLDAHLCRAITKPPVTPAGYVLMPTTPTPQMCAVIRNEHDIYGSAEELYRMVLDAAPKPGEE